VIAELFLEGSSIFSLSQLFKYRNGEYNPSQKLDKMGDPDIKVRRIRILLAVYNILIDSYVGYGASYDSIKSKSTILCRKVPVRMVNSRIRKCKKRRWLW
jgi:hypothetical protein